MKKEFAKALKAKQQQRERNAGRSVAEKLQTLDRLNERSKQLRRAKVVEARRGSRAGE